MRIFMLGDFTGMNGPGIANKTMKDGLKDVKKITYSQGNNKFIRVSEIFFKTIIADKICLCSFSKSNLLAIRVAKFFKKNVYYIMHGYSTYETKINKNNSTNERQIKVNNFEKKIFENVDKVFCVSKLFMNYMKSWEPDYKDKFSYNYTGIDINYIEKSVLKSKKKKERRIVSIGGGMPQKRNLEICKAIEKLNQEKNMKLTYLVIGENRTKKDEIKQYDFVTYIDKMPHDQVLEVLSESFLYIQNSEFETFGVSVIEALLCGCNLLISSNIGAKEVISTIESKDLIFHPSNIEEITKKIENILKEKNVQRLRKGLEVEKLDYKNAAQSLLKKMTY